MVDTHSGRIGVHVQNLVETEPNIDRGHARVPSHLEVGGSVIRIRMDMPRKVNLAIMAVPVMSSFVF